MRESAFPLENGTDFAEEGLPAGGKRPHFVAEEQYNQSESAS
jgi:hypothetical protein